MDNIVPNCNPNLVVLRMWDAPGEVQDTAELPVIAWRFDDDRDAPIPVTVDGEPPECECDDGSAWMLFDRATKTGIAGHNIYTREACVKELHASIARAKKAGAK